MIFFVVIAEQTNCESPSENTIPLTFNTLRGFVSIHALQAVVALTKGPSAELQSDRVAGGQYVSLSSVMEHEIKCEAVTAACQCCSKAPRHTQSISWGWTQPIDTRQRGHQSQT